MPRFTGTVEVHPRIAGAHQLCGHISYEPFRDFVESLKKHTEDIVPECTDKEYRDGFESLTMFDSTLIFHATGEILAVAEPGTYELSLLVVISGLWMSEFSWGYRIDIKQLKLHQLHKEAEQEVRVFVEGKPLLFVPDDD